METDLRPTLRGMLVRDESIKLKPYKDSEGYLSIGVGRCLDTKGISEGEAYRLLDNDIDDAELALRSAFPWTDGLSPERRCVLLNMIFNLGTGGLAKFQKFLAALQLEQWEEAADHMLDSKWARQVKGRADRLAAIMRSGKFPEVY